MNNLEKYLDQVIEQRPVGYDPPVDVQAPPPPPPALEAPTVNVLAVVRRRWYIALAAALVLCALALPAIWLLVEPQHTIQGAVRVAPVVQGVLSDTATPGDLIGAYGGFVNTQAILLMSNSTMLQLIADDLADRNLEFFSGKPQTRVEMLLARVVPLGRKIGPERILRDAISKKRITATSVQGTELITVAMRSTNVEDAKTIVNSFVRNYVAQYGSDTNQKENASLIFLDRQREELFQKITNQRQHIRTLAEEYGTTVLDTRQEMEMARQTALLGELTRLESRRISTEATISLLEKTDKVDLLPEQAVSLRRASVNSDLIVAQQTLNEGHPTLARLQATLETFKKRSDDKRLELEREYDSRLEAQLKETAQQRLVAAQMELAQIQAHYEALRGVVDQQDSNTRQVGRTHLDIQDRQFRLQVDLELHETLSRRIKTLEMEQQRPARIETAYWADVTDTNDRRPQLAIMALLGALGCGFGLALLRDRLDKTLQTPEDLVRHLDLPVLGTTTSSHAIKPALFAEQIAGDYQTIRANLGLQNEGGMPRRLVVSSAGTREGKTTFAVNLATSLAKSGKKVLLVDGDLRKPDVGQMLKIPKDAGYLQDVLLGGDPSSIAYVLPSSGLHVLAANPRHMADPYELLTSSMAAEQIERLSREYDHIIIDSPPALAFPDALVWARLADAVVLVGFAGHTTAPDLKEARERFVRGRARVLGAVLSNVPLEQSLYRYAYTYRVRGVSGRKGDRARKLLLASEKPEDAGGIG